MFVKYSLYIVLTALSLTACSPNLRPSPQSTAGINFAGTWKLDKARSDRVDEELRLILRAAEEKQAKKMRSRRGSGPDSSGFPDGPSSEAGTGAPAEPWWEKEQKRQQEELIAAVTPPDSLRITQTPSRVEVISTAGGAWRVFEPDRPSTLVTDYATWRIQSGWQGNAFVVQSIDSAAKLKVTERYSLDAQGDLDKRFVIDVPDAKTQNYHVIYRRGD